MKLHHPNLDVENRERVQADIPHHIFDYFFRRVLAGEHRARQVLINHFFQSLYDNCLACGIKPEWDPANNHDITIILNRLNFDLPNTNSRPAADRGRRTNSSASVDEGQSAGRDNVG